MKSKWISVEDSLPKSYEKVLTYNKFDTIDFDIYRAIGGWQLCECVTHWMPLPEPPSNKSRYKRLVEEHRCVQCTKPLPEGYKLKRCQECNIKMKECANQYKKKHQADGKCTVCFRDLPPNYTHKVCKSCRIKQSQYYYARKEKSNG